MSDAAPFIAIVNDYAIQRRVVWYREDLYIHDQVRGIYVRTEESCIRRELLDHLSVEIPAKKLTASRVTGALELLKDLTSVKGDLEPPIWLSDFKSAYVVVARNGVVDLSEDPVEGKWRLLPHTPDLFAIGGVDYDYDPGAPCPGFDAFLANMTGNDAEVVDLILRYTAQVFNRTGYRAEALLWFHGRGRDGKSTLFHCLRHVLGEALTSAVDLQAFNSPSSFRLWPLLHMTANFCFDAQIDARTSITALNGWVSGDGVTIDRKYKRPLTIRPKTLLYIASNKQPLADDRSDAFWRRVRPVSCGHQVSVDQVNPRMAEELCREAAGILNRLLAYVPIVEREPVMPVPMSVQRSIDELRAQVGSFALFVAEEIEPSADDHVGRQDLMGAFKEWCFENIIQPVGIQEVKAEMIRLFGTKMHRCRKGPGGTRIDVWSGVRWRRDPEDNLEDAVTDRGLSKRPVRWPNDSPMTRRNLKANSPQRVCHRPLPAPSASEVSPSGEDGAAGVDARAHSVAPDDDSDDIEDLLRQIAADEESEGQTTGGGR
jgi:P4 family phage/plasmid primase-like protien